jgi:hypothetical protein
MVAEQGAKEIGAATRPSADGSAARITEGSIEHYAAHAALGCATGSVSGNCASGATGGVLGEMSALAYKKEHAGSMTQAELRERAGNRAAMIGAVSGAVVGEGGDAVHSGSNAARNAAENNVFRDQIIDKQMELQYLEGQISKEELESYREQKIETIEDIVITSVKVVDRASDFIGPAGPIKAVGKKTFKVGFKKIVTSFKKLVTSKDQKLLINANKNQKLLPAPKTNKQISKAKEDKGTVINTGGVGSEGITVLGKYPTYVHKANDLKARSFNIPADVWNQMTPDEQWQANMKFLDRAIIRKDKIILSNPVRKINETTGYFKDELEYLLEKGYKLNKNGTELIKNKYDE